MQVWSTYYEFNYNRNVDRQICLICAPAEQLKRMESISSVHGALSFSASATDLTSITIPVLLESSKKILNLARKSVNCRIKSPLAKSSSSTWKDSRFKTPAELENLTRIQTERLRPTFAVTDLRFLKAGNGNILSDANGCAPTARKAA